MVALANKTSVFSFHPTSVSNNHQNLNKYVTHRRSSIEWKFEEIDVTELFRFFDEKFPDKSTFYTH
jgi:hypothetical protein